MAITLRQLESLVRIAEARARAALRAEVTVEDAEAAILIMNRSLEDVGIDVVTMKVDVDNIMTGKPKSMRDALAVLLDIIVELQKETGLVEVKAVLDEAERRGIRRDDGERYLAQLRREGSVYEPREGYVKKT
jgi:replicative DNA helicase Mcm